MKKIKEIKKEKERMRNYSSFFLWWFFLRTTIDARTAKVTEASIIIDVLSNDGVVVSTDVTSSGSWSSLFL